MSSVIGGSAASIEEKALNVLLSISDPQSAKERLAEIVRAKEEAEETIRQANADREEASRLLKQAKETAEKTAAEYERSQSLLQEQKRSLETLRLQINAEAKAFEEEKAKRIAEMESQEQAILQGARFQHMISEELETRTADLNIKQSFVEAREATIRRKEQEIAAAQSEIADQRIASMNALQEQSKVVAEERRIAEELRLNVAEEQKALDKDRSLFIASQQNFQLELTRRTAELDAKQQSLEDMRNILDKRKSEQEAQQKEIAKRLQELEERESLVSTREQEAAALMSSLEASKAALRSAIG